MRWLITGGCGFIGRNLITSLLRQGEHAIRVVDNLSVGSRVELAAVAPFIDVVSDKTIAFDAPGAVRLVVGDILDDSLAHRCCQDVDVVVHLAANTGVGPSVDDPRMDCVTNVQGTFNYLEAARQAGVKRFVFASSGAPAGECTPPIHEELPPHPVSPYGASKLAGEGYCSAYFRTYGLETVALRFSNVYGPLSSNKQSVVAKFIRSVLEGQPLEIYGNGNKTRDFLFVEDLVEAIIKAAVTPAIGGEVFQIASGCETTIGALADLIVEAFAQVDPAKSITVRYGQDRLGDVERNFSDVNKARAVLCWQAQVDLRSGLNKTIAWFLTNA